MYLGVQGYQVRKVSGHVFGCQGYTQIHDRSLSWTCQGTPKYMSGHVFGCTGVQSGK